METTELLLDMKESHKTILLDVLERLVPAGLEVWAFGSRARWTARETSDLDLVLRNPAQLGTRLEAGLLDDLKEAFEESDLPFMVDLLDWATVSEKFRKVIEREYVVVRKGGCLVGRVRWRNFKIEELGRIVTGKTPSTLNSENFGDKYPFITPRDMSGQKKIVRTERYLSEQGKSAVKNCLLPTNSICVSCIGSDMGKVVMTSEDSITNQQLNSIVCNNLFDPDFVYYSLVNISAELKNAGHHSTAVPILNKTDFSNFEITAPDLPTQRHIAAILSALDEKIELNRQTNQTLEAIAQALFKEWFVDFNFPGATGEMQESELGPIPIGWRVGTLEELCRNARKTTQPKDIEPDLPYIGLEHLPRKSLSISSWGVSEDVTSQKSYFNKFNILFGKLRPYFHKVCIAPVDGICSTDILVIEPLHKDYFSFCLNHLFSNELIAFVSGIADGTRMPRVDWKSISEYKIVIPTMKLLCEFTEQTIPIYDKLIQNNYEIATFSSVSNILLPKLMNGEIVPVLDPKGFENL